MNKLLGRGPGWVFLQKAGHAHPRWHRIETVDLLSQFESELDSEPERVVDFFTEWRNVSGLDGSSTALLERDYI